MEKLDSQKLKEIFSEVTHRMPMPPELAVENKEKKSKGKSKQQSKGDDFWHKIGQICSDEQNNLKSQKTELMNVAAPLPQSDQRFRKQL